MDQEFLTGGCISTEVFDYQKMQEAFTSFLLITVLYVIIFFYNFRRIESKKSLFVNATIIGIPVLVFISYFILQTKTNADSDLISDILKYSLIGACILNFTCFVYNQVKEKIDDRRQSKLRLENENRLREERSRIKINIISEDEIIRTGDIIEINNFIYRLSSVNENKSHLVTLDGRNCIEEIILNTEVTVGDLCEKLKYANPYKQIEYTVRVFKQSDLQQFVRFPNGETWNGQVYAKA